MNFARSCSRGSYNFRMQAPAGAVRAPASRWLARARRARSGRFRPLQEPAIRPPRYFINVTLDGCCDHRAMFADEDLHRHAIENLDRSDALLFGRVTCEMMEAGWPSPATSFVGYRPSGSTDRLVSDSSEIHTASGTGWYGE